MKHPFLIVFLLAAARLSYAQFPPPAGQEGSTAIHKDSSVFVAWATGCTLTRGLRNIAIPDSGYAEVGDSSVALGIADEPGGVVSLGDGGSAIVTFAQPITNNESWDFAVFENGITDSFLELAFVEVSSDGNNFFRFPATSLTQDTVQIGTFGSVDATKINNLAGKYRFNYGTPFDLEELEDEPGLDVNNITHVKIIDVVGCIQDQYTTYDQHGNKVNELWPTPFASSGFDLDAVGVIHQLEKTSARDAFAQKIQLDVFPNPVQSNSAVRFHAATASVIEISVTDFTGRRILQLGNTTANSGLNEIRLPEMSFPLGIYFLRLETESEIGMQKIVVSR